MKVAVRFHRREDISMSSFRRSSSSCVLVDDKEFVFDSVFEADVKQEDFYDSCVRPLIGENIDKGGLTTILSHGQTGSGKTQTLGIASGLRDESAGVAPRVASQVFTSLPTHKIQVTCALIYLENLIDCLEEDNSYTNLRIRENKDGVYVENLSEKEAKNYEEFLKILSQAELFTKSYVTYMGVVSSKMSVILSIEFNNDSGKDCKILLVDSCGSEKVKKQSADGQTLAEASKIGFSLSSMGQIVTALADGKPHVPYRDSKLTRLLQASFVRPGGFLLVVCLRSDDKEESLSSLRFASRFRQIPRPSCDSS